MPSQLTGHQAFTVPAYGFARGNVPGWSVLAPGNGPPYGRQPLSAHPCGVCWPAVWLIRPGISREPSSREQVADEAVERIILDEVGRSIGWVIRSGGLVAFVPGDSPLHRPDRQPCIDSPVPDAIHVAERLRAGAEEQTSDFSPISGLLSELMESGYHLID